MQILILGMHRSGTSATARLINMMGAYFAPDKLALPTDASNPKGFWERQDVMRLNNKLLHQQQCLWNRIPHWSQQQAENPPPELQHDITSLVASLDQHQPWFLKDPRFCLTLPSWLPALQNPVAVMVYRHPLEIAVSLHKRDNIPLTYSIALWEHYAVHLLNTTRNLPCIYLSHAHLLRDPIATCKQLYADLTAKGITGLTCPSDDAITQFVDPSLYRAKPTAGLPVLSEAQQRLATMLQGTQCSDSELLVSEPSRIMMEKKE